MSACKILLEQLDNGEKNEVLGRFYSDIPKAICRVRRVIEAFQDCFGERDVTLFSVPGRTELGGNHTDHQHGKVLCAAVEEDMLCCASPNDRNLIRLIPEGMEAIELDLNSLLPAEEEKYTSISLVRGVAARFEQLGHRLSGVDIYLTSEVLIGSGLSSSAAFEVLIGSVLNHFFCNGQLDAVEIAKIGQWAENQYFGKPCGLMDQLACAVGGVIAIDFQNPEAPIVEKVNWNPEESGYFLCLIDSGSSHADLTAEYAAIPDEMRTVAAFFGEEVLREVPKEQFCENMGALRCSCGDRAVLRAIHFYEESDRAEKQFHFLQEGKSEAFLELVRQSGASSARWLQNVWTIKEPENQPVSLALAIGEGLLGGEGAIRVHGGGFGGTVQAFVPAGRFAAFQKGMEEVFGKDTCRVIHIRKQGSFILM